MMHFRKLVQIIIVRYVEINLSKFERGEIRCVAHLFFVTPVQCQQAMTWEILCLAKICRLRIKDKARQALAN
jgi:hypothetical protein